MGRASTDPWAGGLLLMLLGGIAVVYGAIRLLAGSAQVQMGLFVTLNSILYRFLGGVCLLSGLGLAALGAVLAFSPETLTALINQWLPPLPELP